MFTCEERKGSSALKRRDGKEAGREEGRCVMMW
jgi:hypothetical protein